MILTIKLTYLSISQFLFSTGFFTTRENKTLLSRIYMKMSGLKLELFKIQTKPIKHFSKNLSLYLITIFRRKG